MHRFAIACAVSALAATATAQFSVVIPNGMAAAEGSTSNAFPWGRGGTGLLIQNIYDSSHFTNQGITFPILITGLKWRPNTNVALVASSYTSGCSVSLSTCPVDQSAVTGVFASNRGADFATVYSGVVSWGPQPAQVGPTPFGISIPFTTPFLYDPNLGDLNVESDLPIQTFTGTGPQLDVHATAPLASRVFLSTGYPVGNGTIGLNHGVVIEVDYTPANGLFANFSGNVTGGATPLNVQFTDSSYSSAPGGITSWAWDFDGDSVIDSTVQNPSFTYTTCGNYTVSLTVTDGVNPPSTKTLTNYIQTDRITANFTYQVIGPLTVQFTDTSNMPASSWAWDFNGDSIIDSTVQNPTFTFPSTAPFNTTLSVTRLCSPVSSVTKSVVAAQQLTTNLAANNSVGTPATLYYNLDVLNPAGVNINGFDSITTNVSTPFTVDVFMKIGTYVGSELNPAPWTKVATASGTSNPVASQPSFATFPLPLHIPQGSYGVAMRYVGITPRYTTLTVLTTYSNGDMSLTAGAASLSTAGPFTGTNLNSPRVWSGTLYYDTNNISGLAGYGWFGPGCAGTLGVSSVVNTNEPVIGTTLQTNVTNLEFGVAVMVLGVSNTLSGGAIPLPLDLGILGAPGCNLRVSLDATDAVVGVGPTVPWNFVIPNVPSLNGALLYNQAAPLSSVNAFGFVTSHAYGWVVGN